jgi:hypothetical protein
MQDWKKRCRWVLIQQNVPLVYTQTIEVTVEKLNRGSQCLSQTLWSIRLCYWLTISHSSWGLNIWFIRLCYLLTIAHGGCHLSRWESLHAAVQSVLLLGHLAHLPFVVPCKASFNPVFPVRSSWPRWAAYGHIEIKQYGDRIGDCKSENRILWRMDPCLDQDAVS